jgi:hypothetical protein
MNAVLPNRTINQLDNSGKIKSQHLSRKAIIYIRQSTLQQVHRHQESTRLQYGLVDRAILLGWPRSDIEIIDDDLGCSGATIAGRQGFQRLVAEVGLDHVGMVLGLEMSRLSRSSRDWYQLLEVCAISSTLIGELHNPIYAGAYAYGRRPTDPRKRRPGRPATGRTVAEIEDLEVLIKDQLPAYITWSHYERNVRQLQANTAQALGVARKGAALLSGLLICGRCGLRMAPHYSRPAGRYRYSCDRMKIDYGEAACQSLSGLSLDECIIGLIFKALLPAALEISMATAEDQAAERQKQQKYWLQRLERTHIDSERAARQYNAVEPENRLVARTLERKWEEALAAESQLKTQYEQFLLEQPAVLTEEERLAIQNLAQDIPYVMAG